MQTITMDTEELDEWIRKGKGYQDEVAVSEIAQQALKTMPESTQRKKTYKRPRRVVRLR